MGPLAAKLLTTETGIPPDVSFLDLRNGTAGGAGYLGTGYNPFTVGGGGGTNRLLKSFDDQSRTPDQNNDQVDGLDTFHEQAIEILRSDKTKKAFDLASEPAKVRDLYGTGNAGFTAGGAEGAERRRELDPGSRIDPTSCVDAGIRSN